MDLTDCVALLTGGSGGLGRHAAHTLAEAGAHVAVAYRNGRGRAEALCKEVEAIGRHALAVPLDVTDPASVDTCIAEVVDRFGALDLLVNNAGMAAGPPPGRIDALTPDIWNRMMAVNLTGPFLVARAAAPHLKASGRGRIVNIGSTADFGPMSAGYAYSVSKAGIVPLTRYLATELAPDVLVNCIAPGLMEGTQMSSGASEAFVEKWRRSAILGKTTSLDDVAAQIVAFCRADTVTGQVLVIDGGIHFN